VNTMNIALQSHFKDFNYAMFEAKAQALLQGAK